MPLFVTNIDPIIRKTLEDRQGQAFMRDSSTYHSDSSLVNTTKWLHQKQSFVRFISNAKVSLGELTTVGGIPNYIAAPIQAPVPYTPGAANPTNPGSNPYGTNFNNASSVQTPMSPTNTTVTTETNFDSEIRKYWILTGGTESRGQNSDGTFYNSFPSGFHQLYSNDRNVPLPGITDVSISNKGAFGSTREAVVKYSCFSVEQLGMLELLFMTPGVSAFIEWGWSLLPNGELNKYGLTADDITDADIVVYRKIQNLVAASCGHYDAMKGIITNFKWSMRTDGGYDCETTIVSMADTFLNADIKSASRGFKGPSLAKTANQSINVPQSNIEHVYQMIKELFGKYDLKETVKLDGGVDAKSSDSGNVNNNNTNSNNSNNVNTNTYNPTSKPY